MRIPAYEGWIEINRGGFDDPVDIDVSIESRGFSGSVWNIFPETTGEFFSDLRRMEAASEGQATLLGTEDFVLVVTLPKGNGKFWLEVQMHDGFGDGVPLRQLRCRLCVDGEYWFSFVSGMRSILVGNVG